VNVKEKQCLLGKFGALVSLVHSPRAGAPTRLSRRELEDFGRQLSQHVVGMNPSQLGYADTKEKKAEAGNEWNLGAQEEDKETIESKACKLVYQDFLHDPTMTAGEYMQCKGLHMIDFVRFECGEAGDTKED
jgi:translation elongation factor EF-Ts